MRICVNVYVDVIMYGDAPVYVDMYADVDVYVDIGFECWCGC